MHALDAAVVLGQMIQPVETVGVYIPGGKALYPSTVLMAGLRPAAIAGVRNIVFCTPSNKAGEVSPLISTAVLDVEEYGGQCRVFKIGGAQAIAAMAYGTETVPKCDVIVGPGNQYVNIAKKLVYGECAIDMLAGPSEVASHCRRTRKARAGRRRHSGPDRTWTRQPGGFVLPLA